MARHCEGAQRLKQSRVRELPVIRRHRLPWLEFPPPVHLRRRGLPQNGARLPPGGLFRTGFSFTPTAARGRRIWLARGRRTCIMCEECDKAPDGHGMGRERNLVLDDRITDFTPTTKIKGEVNREGIRKMTPREWARLQGFPDNFVIPVADASAYKQFGNSVAVPAIQATANEILKLILKTK